MRQIQISLARHDTLLDCDCVSQLCQAPRTAVSVDLRKISRLSVLAMSVAIRFCSVFISKPKHAPIPTVIYDRIHNMFKLIEMNPSRHKCFVLIYFLRPKSLRQIFVSYHHTLLWTTVKFSVFVFQELPCIIAYTQKHASFQCLASDRSTIWAALFLSSKLWCFPCCK